ncbi:MAG: ABC transporter permease [Spirochaetota bacterium]|nr:ABC transporter permease [Spirochaetota bacterium]
MSLELINKASKKKPTHLSPSKLAWKRFKQHKLAMVSLWILIVLGLLSIIMPLPWYDIMDVNWLHPVDKPNIKATFKESFSENILIPYQIKEARLKKKIINKLSNEEKNIFLSYYTFDSNKNTYKLKSELTSKDELNIIELLRKSEYPSQVYILGTDENGFDVFTRLFYGGRISLTVGLVTALFAAFIGTIIGSVAGYFGGWTDSILMRFTDTMLSIPILPLLIILAVLDYNELFSNIGFDISGISNYKWTLEIFGFKLFTIKLAEWGSIIRIILIIALFSWMSVARLVRGEVLSLKQREFIEASKVMGASHCRIIFKHLIPNSLTPVIISTTLALGAVIQYEAVLSFLGLGISTSTPSWGNMLSNSREYFIKSPALFVYPGIFIAITVICINFIGDGLRDALDPRHILGKKD